MLALRDTLERCSVDMKKKEDLQTVVHKFFLKRATKFPHVNSQFAFEFAFAFESTT